MATFNLQATKLFIVTSALYTIVSCIKRSVADKKMVYLNVKYVIATRSYEFFYIGLYTQNLIGNIALSRVIIPVASVNLGTKHIKRYEHFIPQNVRKWTPTAT